MLKVQLYNFCEHSKLPQFSNDFKAQVMLSFKDCPSGAHQGNTLHRNFASITLLKVIPRSKKFNVKLCNGTTSYIFSDMDSNGDFDLSLNITLKLQKTKNRFFKLPCLWTSLFFVADLVKQNILRSTLTLTIASKVIPRSKILGKSINSDFPFFLRSLRDFQGFPYFWDSLNTICICLYKFFNLYLSFKIIDFD